MADYSQSTKANIAIKHLLGKAQTDNAKASGNEAEGIFFNVSSDYIFTENINYYPTSAITQGIAEYISGATLTVDSTSNGHAYFATYPSWHLKVGQRIVNSISPSYGYLYEAKVYNGSSIQIPVGDQRAWMYQYQNGIFFQESGSTESYGGSSLGAPATINLYVYVGETLSSTLSGITSTVSNAAVQQMNLTNKNMSAFITYTGNTNIGYLACDTGITGNIVSGSSVRVFINGIEVNCGNSIKDICFFAENTGPTSNFTNARVPGSELLNDVLYWKDNAPFMLDELDEIDFVFLVNKN
jgi:hypothetical protein